MLSKFKNSKIFLFLLLGIITVALPLTVIQVQKQQEIRQRAAEGPIYLKLVLQENTGQQAAGNSLNATLHLVNNSSKFITAVDATIKFDKNALILENFSPDPASGLSTVIGIDSQAEKWHYVAVNLGEIASPKNDTVLGTLNFTVKSAGNPSPSLNFSNVSITALGNSEKISLNSNRVEIPTISQPLLSPASTLTSAPALTSTPVPPLIPLPLIFLTADKQRAYVGDKIKVTVNASFEDGIGGIQLVSASPSKLSENDHNWSYSDYKGCQGQEQCLQIYEVPVSENDLDIFPVVAKAKGGLPEIMLIENKPKEIYGKTVELVNVTSMQNNGKTIRQASLKIENSLIDIADERPGEYYLINGLAILLSNFSDNNIVNIQAFPSINVKVDSLTTKVNPPSGASGTIFQITTIISNSPRQLSIILNGPSFSNLTKPLFFSSPNYSYALDSKGLKDGQYTVHLMLDGQIFKDKASFVVTSRQDEYECQPIINNGDVNSKINIVVMPNNYFERELDSFRSEVLQGHIDYLFSKEPYDKYKDQFNVWYSKNLDNVNCELRKAGECINTFEKKASSACSFYDKILILSKKSGGGFTSGYGSSLIAVDSASDFVSRSITLHEFGHALGKLSDEYETGKKYLSATNFPNCDVFACPKWCAKPAENTQEPKCTQFTSENECRSKIYNGINCAWFNNRQCDYPYHSNINFGAQCTNENVCLYGCGFTDGYRSSKSSIMGGNFGNTTEYNSISKAQIEKEIKKFLDKKK